jgi:uncharacterized membrane protein HdeD (DUF308 family)
MATDHKLGSHAVWLFAAGTLAVVIGVTYLVPHVVGAITPKAMAAIYFALFGAGATASAFLTRTSALRNIGAFLAAGLGLGVFYYIVVGRAAAAAAESLGASSSGAGGFGATMGLVFAVAFAVDALGAGIAGTLFGLKLRKGMPQMAALKR